MSERVRLGVPERVPRRVRTRLEYRVRVRSSLLSEWGGRSLSLLLSLSLSNL